MTVGVYGPIGVSHPSGAPAALMPVEVLLPGTETPAELYTDETGTTPFAGVLTSDQYANLVFFATPGPYDVQFNDGPKLRVYAKSISASGNGGSSSYTHVQAVPAAVWPVTHNLGRRPFAWVRQPDGSMALTDINHTSANALTATFPAAVAGILEMS